MSILPNQPNTPAIAESSEDVARAIALLSEGVVEPHEFLALTGLDAFAVPTLLQSHDMLAAVQRATLQLRNSGALARLEAARHAREAVEVAASIMRDSEMHASNRLNAATFIAKASGTERPAAEAIEPQERFTITINLGPDQPPVVIESKATPKEIASK
jgi:hypothetical protein